MSDPNAPQEHAPHPAAAAAAAGAHGHDAGHGAGHAAGHGDHTAHKVNAWLVFIWLVVLTAFEIGVAIMHEHKQIERQMMVLLVVGSALIKAGLVGVFFMHLKFEGKLIWGMVIGSILLGCTYLGLLFPDIVFGTLNLFR